MKSIILVVVSLLTVTTNVSAQIAELSLESMLATAPGRARAGAAVIKWNDDYTYETLKEGTMPSCVMIVPENGIGRRSRCSVPAWPTWPVSLKTAVSEARLVTPRKSGPW